MRNDDTGNAHPMLEPKLSRQVRPGKQNLEHPELRLLGKGKESQPFRSSFTKMLDEKELQLAELDVTRARDGKLRIGKRVCYPIPARDLLHHDQSLELERCGCLRR